MSATPSASGPSEVPARSQVLREADELINGDRNETYGTPTQNFTNIAELWSTRFRHKLKEGAVFTAAEVADAMILLKVARNIASTKRDNYVDLAGYAGCGYEAHLTEGEKQDGLPTFQINIGAPNGVDGGAIAESIRRARREGPPL